MYYMTLKQFEALVPLKVKIVEVYQVNTWIVVVLGNGLRFMFKNF